MNPGQESPDNKTLRKLYRGTVWNTRVMGFLTAVLVALTLILIFMPVAERKADDNNVLSKDARCQEFKDSLRQVGGFAGMKTQTGIFFSEKENTCLYVGLDWDDKIKVIDAVTDTVVYSEELEEMRAENVGEETKLLISEFREN